MKTASAESPWRKAVRQQVRDSKRDAVLRTAARLFSKNGYHGTSLELVADGLDITRPTVYYYVKSKDEILFECVRIGLSMIEQAAQDVTSRGGSAMEQLAAVMRKYAEIITMEFGMCLVRVGDLPLPPASRHRIRKLEAGIDRKIRGLVEQAVAEGSFAPCDPKLAAFAIGGTLNSIGRWFSPEGERSAEEVVDQFVNVLLNGLAIQRIDGCIDGAIAVDLSQRMAT